MIVLLAGLPGTGKTTPARQLAARTSGRVISKDEIRHAIFSAEEIEYSTRQDDFCLQVMFKIAGFLLEKNRERMIFLDGRTFSRRYQIENVVAFANSLGQPWRILECVCDDRTAKKRLEQQFEDGSHPAGNRNFDLYLEVKSRFETILLSKATVDTAQPLEKCIEQALAAVQ
jgi:predicted kinase